MRRVIACLIIATCAACSTKTVPPPEKAFDDAMETFGRKYYEDAADGFKKVRELYPDHPLAQKAQLYVGEANFAVSKYDDAVVAYDEFVKLYPGNMNVPYARYKTALSYFKQMGESDREQGFTREALRKFERLIADYPDTHHAVNAFEHLRLCRRSLAEHELFIGNFYRHRGFLTSAERRFKYALANFPDVDIQEEALFGLYRVYDRSGDRKRAQRTAQALLFYFPRSAHRNDVSTIGN